jgi:hypothetical protein
MKSNIMNSKIGGDNDSREDDEKSVNDVVSLDDFPW